MCLLFIVVFTTLTFKSFSQNVILYEFGDSVCFNIEKNTSDSSKLYYLELSIIDNHTSSLSIENFSSNDTLKSLIYQKLVKPTNRFVLINNKHIPIIFKVDYTFAFLGRSENKRKGKYGRIKVLKFSEATVITFKNNGEIINIE